MKKKLLSVLLCICVTAGLLAGCGSSSAGDSGSASESAAGGEAAGTASSEGLAISVCGGSEDAMVLDTAKTATLEGLSACRHLYEGLYKLDQEGNVVLGQASDVQVSKI